MTPTSSRDAPIVLAFDRSDPTGAAGVQSDVLTCACLGCHPLTVVTAVSVQDTIGVMRIDGIHADHVIEQSRALLADMAPRALKIGFLADVAQVRALAEVLANLSVDVPVVLAAPFARLAPAVRDAMRASLVPRATVIVASDAALVGFFADDDAADDAPAGLAMALERAFDCGAAHVLVTTTAMDIGPADAATPDAEDAAPVDAAHAAGPHGHTMLVAASGVLRTDRWPRLPTTFDGASATLAGALAALLANGLAVADAAGDAQEYTWQALAHATRPGRGRHLPDRFFWARHALAVAAQ